MIIGFILNVKRLRGPLIVKGKRRRRAYKNIRGGFAASPDVILFHMAADASSS
jgi:hypothetical protein